LRAESARSIYDLFVMRAFISQLERKKKKGKKKGNKRRINYRPRVMPRGTNTRAHPSQGGFDPVMRSNYPVTNIVVMLLNF